MLLLLGLLLASSSLFAQNACPAWSACDLAFDLMPQENAAQAELRAEFRSPRHKTYLLRAFLDGRKLVIRYAPTEAGAWDYRLTSNLPRLDGQTGNLTAAESDVARFRASGERASFRYGESQAAFVDGGAMDRFTEMPRAEFDKLIEQRAQEKFTHVRVTIGRGDRSARGCRARARDQRQRTDRRLGPGGDSGGSAPARSIHHQHRVAIFRVQHHLGGRCRRSKRRPHGRALIKDAGALLKKLDAYDHPRTTMAAIDVGAAGGRRLDERLELRQRGTKYRGRWSISFIRCRRVNTGIQSQRDLWNATMNGQYPASGAGPYMKAWAEFMGGSRYWELEPYFDVDGGRAVALEDVEYIVYVEKPGLVELTVENHNYDVTWMNPATGELIKLKDYKGEHFTGEPPDKSHDWVLRVSREGRKEGMLKSYKFDSRPVPVQEVEQNPSKIPFEITAPAGTELSLSKPAPFAVKIKRDTRATRSLLVEWTAEVAARWRRLSRGGNRPGGNADASPLPGQPVPGDG